MKSAPPARGHQYHSQTPMPRPDLSSAGHHAHPAQSPTADYEASRVAVVPPSSLTSPAAIARSWRSTLRCAATLSAVSREEMSEPSITVSVRDIAWNAC